LNHADSPKVAIINQDLARKYWPHSDPLGQRIKLHDKDWEIVDVLRDVKLLDFSAPDKRELHLPCDSERALAGYALAFTAIPRENLMADSAALLRTASLLTVIFAPYLLGSENGVLVQFSNYRLFLVLSKQLCGWCCL
jgi:hypothetical protein